MAVVMVKPDSEKGLDDPYMVVKARLTGDFREGLKCDLDEYVGVLCKELVSPMSTLAMGANGEKVSFDLIFDLDTEAVEVAEVARYDLVTNITNHLQELWKDGDAWIIMLPPGGLSAHLTFTNFHA